MPNLVLSRKPGESIRIGEEILITVLEQRGLATRIAIDAPRDIPIDREEIWMKKLASRELAASEAGTMVGTMVGAEHLVGEPV